MISRGIVAMVLVLWVVCCRCGGYDAARLAADARLFCLLAAPGSMIVPVAPVV